MFPPSFDGSHAAGRQILIPYSHLRDCTTTVHSLSFWPNSFHEIFLTELFFTCIQFLTKIPQTSYSDYHSLKSYSYPLGLKLKSSKLCPSTYIFQKQIFTNKKIKKIVTSEEKKKRFCLSCTLLRK